MTLVTDEHRALIGVKGPRLSAGEPIGADSLRRFVQGAMESNPVHWDEEVAAGSRYGHVVATPLFPLHASRRRAGAPDPLDRLRDEPDWDGASGETTSGLPPLDFPLTRILNGGCEATFAQLAKVGDVVITQSHYAQIAERAARDGSPMVIVTIETEYRNQDEDLLMTVRSTQIRR